MNLQPEVALIFVAAMAPAMGLGALVATWAPLGPRALPGAFVAFFWGAVVATTAASWLNDAATATLPELIGSDLAHRLVPALVGPTVEELAKAAGLVVVALFARHLLRDVRAAMTLGALVGFGFAAAENTGYYLLAAVQGGYPSLARAVYLRGIVQGGNHAAFTAVTGAAVALAHRRAASVAGRIGRIALGLGVAIMLHAIWNAIVSSTITDVLCNAPLAGGACAPAPGMDDLVGIVPALEAAFLGPILLVLGRVARSRA